MVNRELILTSERQEVKEKANVLEQVKTTIQRRYPNTIVNLKVQRKGVRTTIHVWGRSPTETVEKLFRVRSETHDLLTKNGFTIYPLTEPAMQSEKDVQ